MNNRSLILIGGGGHAKVATDCATSADFTLLGFVDDSECPVLTEFGLTHLGPINTLVSVLESFKSEKPEILNAVGDNATRRATTESVESQIRLATETGTRNCRGFAMVIHASAVVSPSAAIGCGTLVGPNATINAGASVGRGIIINSGAIVEHDCTISDFVHIAPGTVLGGGVTIGENTLLGLGARVLPGISIGTNVVVGAGSVVCKNIADGETVKGTPAS